MISTVVSFAMHLYMSSFQGVRAVGQVLGYVLPRNMSTIKAKINFNTKHLTKGDPVPPYNGRLRLYNMRFCPYAQRAVLALNAKNIDYDVVNVDLIDKPEWITDKSPLGKVPALEISDGVSVYESLVIVQYLDDAYPEKPLLPQDPVKKAFDKIIVEVAAPQIHVVMFKLIKAPDALTEENIAGFFKALNLVQGRLQEQGTKFLGGEEPGYADYMIWPWFERIATFEDERLKIEEEKYSVLLEYLKNMWEDPVVKEYAVPKEVYQKFHGGYQTEKGKPDYDLLLQNSHL